MVTTVRFFYCCLKHGSCYGMSRRLRAVHTIKITALSTTIKETSYMRMKFTFCPHSVFMRFVWVLNSRVSTNNINWLAFVIVPPCIFFEARTATVLFDLERKSVQAGHDSGSWSFVFHRGSPGSKPGQSIWGLLWTKWYWGSFLSPRTSAFHSHDRSSIAPYSSSF